MSLCSVRERLRRTPLSDAVVRRIRALGLGRERGGAVRLSDEQLREGRRRELGRMGLIRAAANLDELPRAAEAELALAGRSNVGKSSLLNALVGKRSGGTTTRGLAPVQNRPGVTRSLNFYGSERRGARIVDMPGYGFAFASDGATAQWQAAMREFVVSRGGLLRVLLCVDARQSLRALDREFLLMLDREVPRTCSPWRGGGGVAEGSVWRAAATPTPTPACAQAGVPCLVVMTKCDLVPTSELARRFAVLEAAAASLSPSPPPRQPLTSGCPFAAGGLGGARPARLARGRAHGANPDLALTLTVSRSAHTSAHASSPVPRRSLPLLALALDRCRAARPRGCQSCAGRSRARCQKDGYVSRAAAPRRRRWGGQRRRREMRQRRRRRRRGRSRSVGRRGGNEPRSRRWLG